MKILHAYFSDIFFESIDISQKIFNIVLVFKFVVENSDGHLVC